LPIVKLRNSGLGISAKNIQMKHIIKFFINLVPRKYIQLVSHIASKFLALFYMGNKVECPVCGHHYRRFLPYGYVTPRENALCPNCLALERHRLMWLFLKEKTNFFTDKIKLLHVAPEYCFINRFEKLDHINYITADLESPLAKVKMDVQNIPFPDNHFDVLFCNHIMEHVDDYVVALKELYRVLKPGGWGIIQSPVNNKRETTYEDKNITSPAEREKHFGQKDHLREFGNDYAMQLAKGGFTVDSNEFIKTLSNETIEKYGLLAYESITIEETIFVVSKRL
jgi:predicted SAM-dependent methyltransferase